jgi:hypothetical protein
MKIIKELSEMIEDELDGAEEYAENAVVLMESHPSLSKVFYEISLEEVKHINMLHEEVKKLIEQHRKEKGEPPVAMMAVYDYLHKKHIEKMNEIKAYQAQYKERAYS